MPKTSIAELKHRIIAAEQERDYCIGLLDAFWTGNIPDNSSMQHAILAQWGRKRLESIRKQPALLTGKPQ